MNDPFECLAKIDRTFDANELDRYRQTISKGSHPRWQKVVELNDDKLTKLLNEFRKESLKKYAFCSLSEDPNNILMWSHYADNHSGIVVGFEFPELENNHDLQKVLYHDELAEIDLERHAKFQLGELEEYLLEIFKDYSIKSKLWCKEKEWRIWRSKPCYYQYKPEQVKEVHFGLNTDIETKSIILKLMNYLPKTFLFNEKELIHKPLGIK